eukprot:2813180-Amphidinium_carterae.1
MMSQSQCAWVHHQTIAQTYTGEEFSQNLALINFDESWRSQRQSLEVDNVFVDISDNDYVLTSLVPYGQWCPTSETIVNVYNLSSTDLVQ